MKPRPRQLRNNDLFLSVGGGIFTVLPLLFLYINKYPFCEYFKIYIDNEYSL